MNHTFIVIYLPVFIVVVSYLDYCFPQLFSCSCISSWWIYSVDMDFNLIFGLSCCVPLKADRQEFWCLLAHFKTFIYHNSYRHHDSEHYRIFLISCSPRVSAAKQKVFSAEPLMLFLHPQSSIRAWCCVFSLVIHLPAPKVERLDDNSCEVTWEALLPMKGDPVLYALQCMMGNSEFKQVLQWLMECLELAIHIFSPWLPRRSSQWAFYANQDGSRAVVSFTVALQRSVWVTTVFKLSIMQRSLISEVSRPTHSFLSVASSRVNVV